MRRDASAGDDERHGEDDEDDARPDARRHRLAEDGDAEEDGGQRFQCAQNRGRRGADVLDGAGRAEERDGGREDGECEQIAPQVPFVDDEQFLPELDADEEKAEPDHERVERQGQRCDLLQQRLVDTHDVNGIRERGGDDKGDADGVERRPVLALIEQADTDERQPDANEGLYRQLLLEEDCHNEGDQYRVDKQDGRRDAGFHVIITFEQRQRRDRHQQSHDDNRDNLFLLHLETPSSGLNHEADNRDGKQITEKEYRVRIHSFFI